MRRMSIQPSSVDVASVAKQMTAPEAGHTGILSALGTESRRKDERGKVRILLRGISGGLQRLAKGSVRQRIPDHLRLAGLAQGG